MTQEHQQQEQRNGSNNNSNNNKQRRMITHEELSKHNKIDDLWLAIDRIVYDVTPFMDDHPGGGEIMLQASAKDGTDDFEDVGHSPHARELLKKFVVGEFEGEFSALERVKRKQKNKDQISQGEASSWLAYALPVLVLLCAVCAYYIGKR